MVYHDPGELDGVFAALADPTRRAIVARLAKGEASVSELAEPFAMSLPAVFKHLQVLKQAGLVDDYKLGRVRRCRLTALPLQDAHRWIGEYGRFWDGQLDALAGYLSGPAED
jgi:DNA-binding transcriptional ArsR family regulator